MANNTLLASDNFASGSLAAGWAAFGTLLKSQVVSGTPNVTESNVVATATGQIWTGLTWPNDQISEITINALTAEAGTTVAMILRCAPSDFRCYFAQINNGSLFILSLDSSGNIIATLTTVSVTVAAGDVWSFQAAGSCLTVYQNYTLRARVADATYTSGSPGFDQNTASGTSLTHSQVSAWRGYSAVQQDGIWQKQPVIIAPNATDLGLSPASMGFQATNVLYDTNPQILPGPQVYKTWAANNWAATTNVGGVYYFESADGITWSRKATAVLTGYTNIFVTKQASTYYMYAQTNAGNGAGTIQVLTSADGITWALQSPSQTISLGTSGAWDDTSLYSICGVQVVSGTWHGFYGATGSTASGLFSTGLVTSADGINWVKSASNPVLTGVLPATVLTVGTAYYGWFQANQPGQGNAHDPLLDPIEIVRYRTTDFIHWTNPASSLHHSRADELVNNTSGYVFAAGMLDVGGKAYLWYNEGQDGVTPWIGQLSLAIGPAPIASIVTAKEDGVQQVAADAFQRADGSLGANWTGPTYGGSAAAKIASHLVEPTAINTVCIEVYTGASVNADQYSEFTLTTLATVNDGIYLILRASLSALTFYQFVIPGPAGTIGLSRMSKWVAGVNTTFGRPFSVTPQLGDVFRFEVVTGSDGFPVLSAFQNGFLVQQVQDIGNSITTGNPGFYFFGSDAIANMQISSWAGGNANVIPAYGKGSLLLLGVGN